MVRINLSSQVVQSALADFAPFLAHDFNRGVQHGEDVKPPCLHPNNRVW